MNNSCSLVVSLRPPGDVTLKPEEPEPLGVHGHPDWLGLPDALIDEDKMVLIGLVFPIVGNAEIVRTIVAKLDARYVCIRDVTDEVSRKLYFGNDDERWLEIKWADANKIGYLPAQIADVDFDFASEDVSDQTPTRMELQNCYDVAAELGLRMPEFG